MKKTLVLFYLAVFSTASLVCAQDRGLRAGNTSSNEQRVALVIGNASYVTSPLANPVNDARDVAKALGPLGFKVTQLENVGYKEMKRAIQDFGNEIRNGGVGLFYFAGHGIQFNGENYLIPVDTTITKEEEVEFESVNVGWLLAQMKNARNRLNIVILDACRNNPFARSFRSSAQGLAMINAPSGTFIAYSTAPGSVASDGRGRNSPYAEALVGFLNKRGLKVEDVFKMVRNHVEEKTSGKQTPWETSSLKGDFCFAGCDGAGNISVLSKLENTNSQADIEQAFWDAIESSNDPQVFRNYLSRYPNGKHKSKAETRMRQLAAQPTNSGRSSAQDETNDNGSTTRDAAVWKMIEDKRVIVSATTAWTSANLKVEENQQISINATGSQLSFGAYGYGGPDGVAQSDPSRPLRDCPTGALIARIGSELICVRSRATFTARSAGDMSLGINESKVTDNSGSFIAKVQIYQLSR